MQRIYSNRGIASDLVINPFNELTAQVSHLYLAAPYFTTADPLVGAVAGGKRSVQLLVGMNSVTSPTALKQVHDTPGISIRYLTTRFHAKIYIFGNAALLGSSNLTDGGLHANREAVICLDRPEDEDAVEEIRALFQELWESGRVLTPEKLDAFTRAHRKLPRRLQGLDSDIEKAVGRAEPHNISVDSHKRSSKRVFLEELRQGVYEEYRPAFSEVKAVLEEHSFRRADLADVGMANETNRFLNFVRLTYAPLDKWKEGPLLDLDDRRAKLLRLGREWVDTKDHKVHDVYARWLENVNRVFGDADTLKNASRDEIMDGLLSLHAFAERSRFVKGGRANLPTKFWTQNRHDHEKVMQSLSHLLYGPGDFINRLHDILYDPSWKLREFGYFCALELFGTVKPDECPPMNGRIAKALRYLGFNVHGG